MVYLPSELLGAVVAEVHSQPDLLRLRTINKTLNAFATPFAFRSIQFSNKDKSLENFKRLTNHPEIAPLIHEVVYQYKEAGASELPRGEFKVRGFDTGAFVEAIALFVTLPALKDLVLRFREHDGPFKPDAVGHAQNTTRGGSPDVVLQFLIFRALHEVPYGFPAHLRSLTIDKFLPLPHPDLESESILRHLSTLTHLAINTTSHCESFSQHDPRSERSSNLRIFPKAALSSSLVSLQLHNVCVRSAVTLIPVSEIHLPRLEYLSLQRTYFSKQGEVESFIARHGGTLVELELFLCPMAMSTSSRRGTADEDFYRWSKVWDHFNRELRVLKKLVVSDRHDSDGVEDAGLGRYIDNCYHCKAVQLKARITRADDKVFERFQKSVESRS